MSAIFGILSLNDRFVTYTDLNRMKVALLPHGPDGGGIWIDKNIGLGQCLMCMTPEDLFETQPLLSKEGNFVLVSDGSIHNRHELAQMFKLPPSEEKEMPDSKFIGLAYEKWGEECVQHLIGSFAFGLWDIKKRSLFMACSPTLTAKPIFYHSTPKIFIFATMPKAFLSFPNIRKEMDLNHLTNFLLKISFDLGSTFYKSIKLLNGGCCLSLKEKQLKIKSYYRLDSIQELRLRQDEEYVEAFQELFERVISDNLRSITPVGISMSGGLDSTSIGATAAQLLGKERKRLTAFTEVPPINFEAPTLKYHYPNETPFVQAMGKLYPNLDLNFVRTDGSIFLDDLDTFFNAAEMPFINPPNRLWIEAIFKQARDQGIRILLSGVGGNLTISWNGSGLLPYLFIKGKWLHLLQEAYIIAKNNGQSLLHVLTSQLIFRSLPRSFKIMALKIYQKENSILNTNFPWQPYSPILPEFMRTHKLEEYACEKILNAHLSSKSFNFRLWRLNRLMPELQSFPNYFSGTQALFGVEERFPAYDSRIIEFCLSLPEDQFYRKGISRWLLKRTMKNKLPQEILTNTKRGLQSADYLERLFNTREKILVEIDKMDKNSFVKSILDLRRLRALTKNIPLNPKERNPINYDYMDVLQRGLMMGRFLLWFEKI